MNKPVPWTQASYIDETNRASGVAVDGKPDTDYEVLSPLRRSQIMRRIADLNTIQPEALDEAGAREAFKDARRICNIYASDNLAKRNWFVRLLRLW